MTTCWIVMREHGMKHESCFRPLCAFTVYETAVGTYVSLSKLVRARSARRQEMQATMPPDPAKALTREEAKRQQEPWDTWWAAYRKIEVDYDAMAREHGEAALADDYELVSCPVRS